MKTRIETALAKIGKAMQEQLVNEQFDIVANTSILLSRARQLQKQIEKDEGELFEIEKIVKNLGDDQTRHSLLQEPQSIRSGRSAPQTLRINIDWKANKRNRETEEIYSSKATEVMVKFVTRMIEEFGKDAQQKLLEVRANRGPLLSRSPEKHFGGYQHKAIPGTDCFLLTHSSTPEKREMLEKICRVLGLVPGSVEIKIEERY
jgi:hypothetical protein